MRFVATGLRPGRTGVRFLEDANISLLKTVQTGSGTQPAYSMFNEGCFPGSKAA